MSDEATTPTKCTHELQTLGRLGIPDLPADLTGEFAPCAVPDCMVNRRANLAARRMSVMFFGDDRDENGKPFVSTSTNECMREQGPDGKYRWVLTKLASHEPGTARCDWDGCTAPASKGDWCASHACNCNPADQTGGGHHPTCPQFDPMFGAESVQY